MVRPLILTDSKALNKLCQSKLISDMTTCMTDISYETFDRAEKIETEKLIYNSSNIKKSAPEKCRLLRILRLELPI